MGRDLGVVSVGAKFGSQPKLVTCAISNSSFEWSPTTNDYWCKVVAEMISGSIMENSLEVKVIV